MPSHAAPRGAPKRPRDRAGRWRRLRSGLPLFMVLPTASAIAGPPPAPTGRDSLVQVPLGIAEQVLLIAAVAVPVLLGVGAADARARTLASRQVRPRPRWQYLALALGCAGAFAAAFTAAGAVDHGKGVLANAAGMSALWCAAAALTMLARALCWGRARRALYWHRPQWLTAQAGRPA